MISAHCGVRLMQTRPHIVGKRVGQHKWCCAKCGKVFTQRIRKSRKTHIAA